MDFSIVSISGIALPFFTGGLVFATVCLWRSTNCYAKATEHYAEVPGKLLRTEQWNVAYNLLLDVLTGDQRSAKMKEQYLQAIFGVGRTEKLDEAQKRKWIDFRYNIRDAHGRLSQELLDDVLQQDDDAS
jgi:hypothetical protein